MKIGLINPPHKYKTDKITHDFFHISGIGYIESVLRKNYETVCVDFQHDKNASLELISDCDIIGITSYIDCYDFFKEFLPQIKNRKRKIIVGGPLISSYGLTSSNVLMQKFPEIDYGVIGEGEITIENLIKKIKNSDEKYPSGIIYREDSLLKTTGHPKIIHDLDLIPEIDYSKWGDLVKKIKGHVIDLQTSRGCYNHCSFCYKIAPKVRTFSIERINREIEKIVELNPRSIFFHDDVFAYDKKRALEISEVVNKYKIPYEIETRVNDVDKEVLKCLKRTGCNIIRFGIESFNEKILQINRKNITKKQIYKAISKSKEAGLKTIGFFIIGLPGETRKSIEETIDSIKKTQIIPRVRLLMPLPGTKIYKEGLEKKMIDEVELLKIYSKHYDTTEENFVPINLTNLSDKELIEARDRIKELRKEIETK